MDDDMSDIPFFHRTHNRKANLYYHLKFISVKFDVSLSPTHAVEGGTLDAFGPAKPPLMGYKDVLRTSHCKGSYWSYLCSHSEIGLRSRFFLFLAEAEWFLTG